MPFLKYKNNISGLRSNELNKLSIKSGWRHIVFNSLDDKYMGEWKNNEKCGRGLLLSHTLDQYEGDFKTNFKSGFGLLSYALKKRILCLEYRGEYKNGKRHGFGLMKFYNGNIYIGTWNKGKRQGFGRMWYINGDFYEGEWNKDKRHGCGMLIKSNDNWYQGEWSDDMKNGQGALIDVVTGQLQKGFWAKGFCICSYIIHIFYRENSANKYPIKINKLVNPDILYNERELKILRGEETSSHTVKLNIK